MEFQHKILHSWPIEPKTLEHAQIVYSRLETLFDKTACRVFKSSTAKMYTFMYDESLLEKYSLFDCREQWLCFVRVINALFRTRCEQDQAIALYVTYTITQEIKSTRLKDGFINSFAALDMALLERLAESDVPANMVLQLWNYRRAYRYSQDFSDRAKYIPHLLMSRCISREVAVDAVMLSYLSSLDDAMICISKYQGFTADDLYSMHWSCPEMGIPRIVGIDVDEFVGLYLDAPTDHNWADLSSGKHITLVADKRKRINNILIHNCQLGKGVASIVGEFAFTKLAKLAN